MKTLKTLTLMILAGTSAIAQTIVSDNNTAVLLTPEGIQIKPDSNYNDSNLGLGTGALQKNTGNNNTAYGSSALSNTTSSINNTAIGANTLISNTDQEDNTAIGANSQSFNAGSKNTSVGVNTLESSAEGDHNTAIGYEALKNNNQSENTAVGSGALRSNINGQYQTAVGFHSLYNLNEATTFNTALGYKSLELSLDGSHNTAVGARAQQENSGSYNIAMGVDALGELPTIHNIAIGNEAMLNAQDVSNCVVIGSNAGYQLGLSHVLFIDNYTQNKQDYVNQPLIGGKFRQGFDEPAGRVVGINRKLSDLFSRSETLQVEGEAFKTIGGGNWITTSDRRLKEKIQSLNADEVLQKVLSLQGVNYEWKDKTKGEGIQYGFIAQDLQKVFPTKVQENKNGYLSASYGDFDPFLVEAIKALHQQIKQLEGRLESSETELAQLKSSLSATEKPSK